MSQPAGSPDPTRGGVAAWLLGRPLTISALVVAAGLLATWIPHYLTWPLWLDSDAFLMMARSWDLGRAPYRDITTFNFPGETYGMWLIGRTFGWDRAPFAVYAIDAAVVVAFGAALVLWSRRQFGRALPGAGAFVAFLWVYLSLDVMLVAQRDWHGPALAMLAIMIVESTVSRAGRVASALAFSAAFIVRPHVVLFLPAILSALLESRDGRPSDAKGRIRGVAEWAAAAAVGLAIVLLPLIVDGIVPDFVRCVSIAAPGGAYSAHGHRSWGVFLAALWTQLAHVKHVFFPAAAWLLAVRLRSPHRALARTWAIAAAAMFVYLPLHPASYGYLEIPGRVVTAVNAGVVVGVVLTARAWSAAARLVVVLATAYLAIPGTPFELPARPTFCSVSDSTEAVASRARGELPASTPPGARLHYRPSKSGCYEWDDYRRLIAYLRTNTRPSTRIASLFKNWCFPAVHGMTARTSVFPMDQGAVWMWAVDVSYAKTCIDALETTPDSIVVWVPGEQPVARFDADFDALDAAVRRLYVPDAKFGAIEVWRRK